MKGKFWRKALAAALALLIVSGGVPVKPFTAIFSPVAITAEAVAEQTVTYTIEREVNSSGTSYIYYLVGSDGSKNMVYNSGTTSPTRITIDMSDDVTVDVYAGGNLIKCDYTNKDLDMLGFSYYFNTNPYDFTFTSKTRIIKHVQIDGMGYVNCTKAKTSIEADGNDKTITVHWEGGSGGNRLGAPGKFIVTYAPPVQTYNINYELNGGTNASSNPATYDDDKAVTLANPTRTGYTFGGWYDNASFSGSPVTSIPVGSSGDKTLYAKWTINSYTVTWKNADGSTLKTDTVNNGDTPSYSGTPTKASDDKYSYTFSGWSPAVSAVTSDTTYTAQYTKAPIAAHFSQNGDTYTIHDEMGWEIFCDCLQDSSYDGFSGKTVVLDKDITVTEMAGSRENPFKGTFDGGKHTITADISGSTMGVAVFSGINTATIKDLTLSGSITGGQHCGALVGLADGTNTIENVNVTADVRLDSSISAGQAHHGGVIGHALSSNTTLRGVVYSGTISSTSASNYVYVGGLVGWADDATITIENSLFAGTYNGGTLFHPILCKTGDKTVNGTFTNVYYTTAPTATNTNYYVANAGKAAHTITAGENVTIGYGTAANTYDVSGITAYANGIAYNGNFYAGEGDEVALTLDNTAPEGYTFNGYSVNAGTLADGTLTMPNGDVTVDAEYEKAQEPVTYIDENGVEKTASAIPLDGTETTINSGWYVVNSNISYDHTLNINGNVSLILSDGYTMTVAPTGYGDGICDSKSTCSLDVYGQSSGTGKLSIATKGSYHYDAEQGFIGETGNSIYVDTYTQHSGTVEISTSGKSGNGISVNKPFIKGGILNTNTVNGGIAANEEITITGGKITVGDNEDNGIGCFNFGSIITLGLTNPEDFITASSYFVPEEFVLNGEVLGEAGTLKIADGQTLTDGTNAYSGTLSPEQITALSGKTLALANAVNIANGIENGTVTADKAAVAKSAKDDERTVTLTVTPDEGYAVKSVSVNGTAIEPVEDVYSFTMPDEDVTVSAEFIMYTLVPAVEPTYTEAGNSEYYIGSDGKYYVLDGSEYTEIEENSWILPMLEKTEVIINSVDINGNSTSTTVYAETYTSADYTVPSAPYLDGYDFKGWTVNDTLYTTADEVQTAVETLVKSGTAVTVKVDYEKKTETHTVNVVDGTLVDKNQTSDTYEVADIVYVVANEAPEGQRFDHWEKNGAVVGYDTSYSFPMPSEDVTITAVYAADETPVEKKGTAYIESVTKVSGNKLVFVSILSVPENCRIVSAGLVATNDDTIGADICAESVTTNPTKKVFVKQAAGSNRNVKYTWTKSNVSADETWYVKAYLVYIDTNGNTQTVYGDLVTASIN